MSEDGVVGGHAGLSRRPYLLRAMHEWMNDGHLTPHIIVDAQRAGVEVPLAYIKDGKIVLNLSYHATQGLLIRNDWISFDARFAGVVHHVRVPVSAVLGIYARESGEGMVFSAEDVGPEPPPDPETAPGAPTPEKRRAQFKVVK
ncbi:MAG TPA: ClpXP protease specificity-enhancing factor [Steroidobacteraceae bacterium]|nr:ClpXP protease specificity-enhancing factor [Steroidobacteraceae bacterium]